MSQEGAQAPVAARGAWLAGAPDPERAAALAARVLEAAAGPALERALRTRPEGIGRVLAALCGVAPFLGRTWLVRHPEWLLALAEDDLREPLEAEALAAKLDVELAAAPEDDAARVLREFKYRCLARVTVRDCCAERVPLARSGETLSELTALAEVLLDRALRVARARVEARHGPPTWRDAQGNPMPGAFVVLGLGKLGGEELNYSSDVDLVYVHDAVADAASGPQELAPADYFTRVAQELARLVATETEHGFLYRIDLDLRPEGSLGPVVVSDVQLGTYYETAADHWEKVAFMKARPVAGDLALGWRAVRAVHPMIYRTAIDYAGVRRIRELKERIGRERSGDTLGFDVKLDPGGIRDVEFAVQALQLLHGGRIEQLRDRSTQRTLARLAEVRVLPAATASALLDAYRFLRRVENRLQMENEQQLHRVPAAPAARERLARAMGFGGGDALARFDAALDAERRRVLEAASRFQSLGDPASILELFARHQPRLLALPATRSMLEALAEAFARAIASSSDPELALANLDRFVEGVGARRFYYELLLDRPELVERLTALFAASRFLSTDLARHPRLIEPVFADPNVLLLSREALRADLAALRAELAADGDLERELDALRRFQHRQVMNVGLLDVGGRVPRAACEMALTDIAEVTLEAGLELARGRPGEAAAEAARFLVVGMGKLASRELSYGSDLDLIFLYDLAAGAEDRVLEAQEHCVRLAQRLIAVIETPTTEGACYEVDARLRPSGSQGSLVTSLAALRAYHEAHGQVWERQALLRARAVAGDPGAAEAFEAIRLEIVSRELPPDAAAEIHRIRQRMEAELADESGGRRDLKRGRGGLLDVENAVQYLQLRHGRDHPELLEVTRTEVQIERLAALGLLAPRHADALREGWEFLGRLASRLRIVENRSISDLDAGRGELDAIARRLGYAGGTREASARSALLRDYARHTEAIRAAYLEILGVPG
jgi:glutamate-ammonia-ligase adenylyltransferase